MKAEAFRKDLFEHVNAGAHELSQRGKENAEQFVPWRGQSARSQPAESLGAGRYSRHPWLSRTDVDRRKTSVKDFGARRISSNAAPVGDSVSEGSGQRLDRAQLLVADSR